MRKGTTKNIVVIGGGTGTYTVLSGLKNSKRDDLSLTAIVSVSDSGGSTGRLRDEFGYLPVGDVRMALAALAEEDEEGIDVLRKLFLYRFSKGEGLKGHNFGNLFLVAMTDILGSEERAIAFASRVLRVKGRVIPVTTDNVTLCAAYEDGTFLEGENDIDEQHKGHDGTKHIKSLSLKPHGTITKNARKAIEEADLIVLGPGDLYTSLLANVIVKGAAEAITESKAPFVYIMNLMTKYGQTHNFSAADHVAEVEMYTGRSPDFVLINKTDLPKEILSEYEKENEFPIRDDLKSKEGYVPIRKDLLAPEEIVKPSGDVLRRSLIRHDSGKLAHALLALL